MMQPVLWILCMLWVSAATEDCQDCQGTAPPSKAGVAMLVRTKKAEIASAVASMEEVKLNGIEQEAALINKVLANPTAELTESMVNQLASMRITPEVKTFLEATMNNLKPVFNDLVEATTKDTAERNASLNKFNEIKDKLDTNQVEYRQGKKSVKGYRTQHVNCRGDEKTKKETMLNCRAEEATLKTAMEAAKAQLETREGTLKGLLCNDDDATNNLKSKIDSADPYAEAGQAYIKAADDHAAKVEECNGFEKEWKTQKNACSVNQVDFENQMCTFGGKCKGWCRDYETAYETLKGDFQSLWDSIQGRVTKRLFEWTHLKRVECVLQALQTLATDTSHAEITSSIQTCNANPYENADLRIAEISAPDKEHCKYTDDLKLPCSEDFVKTEYESLPKEAPADKCTATCDAPE